MRWTHFMLVVAGIFLGAVLSHLPISRAAEAPSGAIAPGRYQLSAFGTGPNMNAEHGCYVLDTSTGKVWRFVGDRVTELGAVGK